MDYLPIGLKITGRLCLLVGGGEVAMAKAKLLRRAGAQLRVVAPRCLPELAAWPMVDWYPRHYESADLLGVSAVVVAIQCSHTQGRIAEEAAARGIPVNVVDVPALCTFVVPSVVDRHPILVAILSGGAAPVLARRLRGQIEALLPAKLGALAALLQSHRAQIKQQLPDLARRRLFFETVLSGPIPELVYRDEMDAAERELCAALCSQPSNSGVVYLVAVGPGDPELLTLRAQRVMQQADRVLYSATMPAAVVDRCRRDALLESWSEPLDPLEDRAERLARYASAGERAAVLVLGPAPDPDGTYARMCVRYNVRCEQVPGVSLGSLNSM